MNLASKRPNELTDEKADRMVAGVDSGKTGAFCFIELDTGNVHIYDNPVYTLKKSREKTYLDVPRATQLLDHYRPQVTILEQVWGMAHDGGVQAFSLGHNYGCIEACLNMCGTKIRYMPASLWKDFFKLLAAGETKTEKKKRSIAMATKLLGTGEPFKGEDGRAEAFLMACVPYLSHSSKKSKPLKLKGVNDYGIL